MKEHLLIVKFGVPRASSPIWLPWKTFDVSTAPVPKRLAP
jgi:hypothetical protein